MKQKNYGIIGIVGVFLLLLGAAGAYAYTNNGNNNMMENQGNYNGMMNGNHMNMMKNLDKDKMNVIHEKMMKNLDPETAKQMDSMHDACMGNTDEDVD